MEDIIAKPKKSLLASYIVIVVFGAILAGVGAYVLALDLIEKFVSIVFLCMGIALFIVGIVWTVIIATFPQAYITLKDGRLHFSNGVECSPSEVDYCNSTTWGLDGVIFNYGTLIVSVRQQRFKFRFVSDVKNVTGRLMQLKSQYALVEDMQRQIAGRNAREKADAALNDAASNNDIGKPAQTEAQTGQTENKG